jgi:class 3 adenylate cyclase
VTLNDRIDYFGQTVNIASRVQATAEGNELLLTEETYAAEGVRELLKASNCSVTSAQASLRSIEQPLTIYRVAGCAD